MFNSRAISYHADLVENVVVSKLDNSTVEEIKREWREKPAVDAMYPEQRRDFYISKADQHGLLMDIPLCVFGG